MDSVTLIAMASIITAGLTIGDDRVHGNLPFCDLNVSYFRQSVLESCDRRSRREVNHADRLVHRWRPGA
jgi:hypothetical protein